MADQRLVLSFGDRSIVLAKRHNIEWVSSQDDGNDLGEFLNSVVEFIHEHPESDRPEVCISYESEPEYCDPVVKVEEG